MEKHDNRITTHKKNKFMYQLYCITYSTNHMLLYDVLKVKHILCAFIIGVYFTLNQFKLN